VLTGLYLNISTTRTQNVKMLVGQVSETISVSASGQDVTLNTTDATIGNNFQVQYMNELPVSLRDSPLALFTQQPGMTMSGSSTGSRTDQNRITLDGLDVSDMALGAFACTGSVCTTITANAPVDAVQEMRGTTAGMLASNGNGGGGQFDMVTKSGTNKFHGNINEYHRDTDLEANEWFNNFEGVPRSPLIRNQFGGNFGGPFWKNKVFFFFDYNGRRDTIAGQAERTVPTDSFLKDQTVTYYTNITSGATSNINASQVAGFDPQGKGFNQSMMQVLGGRYPSPNDFTGDKGDLLNTAGYRFNAPTLFKENNYVGKIDVNPWTNHHLFGRVTYNQVNTARSAPQFPVDGETYPYLDNSHAWAVGWDWTIGANKTNSLVWGTTIAKISELINSNSPSGPNTYSWDGDPTGGTFLDAIYASPSGGTARYFPIPVVRDDFHWSKGRHELSFGGTFKYPTPDYGIYSDYNGATVGLGGGVTGLTDSDSFKFRPDNLDRNQTSLTIYDSALVLGLGRFASAGATWNYDATSTVTPQGTGLQTKYKYYETEVYFADTWKVTPSFTVTYGLRYQNYTVPYEVHGIESVQSESFWNFMNARIAQSTAGVGGAASLPGAGANTVPYISYNLGGKANHGPAFFSPSNLNYAPRVAFAWTPYKNSSKLVVNGGAGIVYDQTIVNAILQEEARYSYLFQSAGTKNYGVTGAGHSPAYYSLLNNPRFTSLTAPPPGPSAPTITKPYTPFVGPGDPNCLGAAGPCGLANGGAFNVSVDRYLPTPYNIMFNLGIQQEFKGGLLLKLGYVGRLGRRLLAQADAEQLIDFPDKSSGQVLSQAMANLTAWLRANPNAKPASAPPQPWFEHVLTPVSGQTETNTGYVAANFAPYPARGDVADAVELMSNAGMLPDNVGMAAQLSENTFFTDMGFSSYNGMLVTLHKNSSHGLQFDLNYTWSHSVDNVSQIANSYAYGGYGFICDVLRPRLCRGNSDFNLISYLNGNFLYQLPFGRGRDFAAHVPRWADEVIGGWELSGLPTWHSGTPYMANSVAFLMSYSNEDPAILTGTLGPMKAHVTKQGGQLYSFKDPQLAFNQYRAPLGFEMGSRNNLAGPGFFLLDLGLGKTFPVYKERWNVKFRVDAFNALNHPNFQQPSFTGNMSLVSPPNEFGVIPGTVIPNGSDLSARVLQGALRLEF
jgi:hypothetical protein